MLRYLILKFSDFQKIICIQLNFGGRDLSFQFSTGHNILYLRHAPVFYSISSKNIILLSKFVSNNKI